MPETAVDENRESRPLVCKVRPARERGDVASVSKPVSTEPDRDGLLRLCPLLANAAHKNGAPTGCDTRPALEGDQTVVGQGRHAPYRSSVSGRACGR
jgi:hypothetical protein